VQLDLPETGVCSATLGAGELAAEATAAQGRPQLVTISARSGGCCG
jgi:hypothetical protein